jgi:hypothetical protein
MSIATATAYALAAFCVQAGALAAAAAAAAPAAPAADTPAAAASMPFLAWLKQQAAEQEAAAAAAAAEARAAKRQRVSEAGASVASPAGALHRHSQCNRTAERFTAKMSSSLRTSTMLMHTLYRFQGWLVSRLVVCRLGQLMYHTPAAAVSACVPWMQHVAGGAVLLLLCRGGQHPTGTPDSGVMVVLCDWQQQRPVLLPPML